jgi:hypothetical protein
MAVVEVQTTPDHQVNSGGGCIDGSYIHPPPFSRQRYALKWQWQASLSIYLFAHILSPVSDICIWDNLRKIEVYPAPIKDQ